MKGSVRQKWNLPLHPVLRVARVLCSPGQATAVGLGGQTHKCVGICTVALCLECRKIRTREFVSQWDLLF